MINESEKDVEKMLKKQKRLGFTLLAIMFVILSTLIAGRFLMASNHAYYQENQVDAQTLHEDLYDGLTTTVYFYNEACPKCIKINKDLQASADEHGVTLLKMNTATEPYQEFDVEKFPTVIYYKGGDEENRLVGMHTKAEFDDFFDKNLTEEIEPAK